MSRNLTMGTTLRWGLLAFLLMVVTLFPAASPALVEADGDAMHVPGKDWNLHSDNDEPRGMWSDGATVWITDIDKDKIFAYDFRTKERKPSEDFNSLKAAGNTEPGGIWSDGATMWVMEFPQNKIFAYDMRTKDRVSSKEINNLRAVKFEGPIDIWGDGATLWVSYWIHQGNDHNTHYDHDNTINAFSLETLTRDPSKDISIDHHNPEAIWSDGTTMWVNDWYTNKVHAYKFNGTEDDSRMIKATVLHDDNDHGWGMWSDGEIMYLVDSEDAKVFAYDISHMTAPPSLDSGNIKPSGIWSDGAVTWVSDWHDSNDKLYAYSTRGWQRLTGRDVVLRGDNGSAHGVWGNDTYIWVADWNSPKLFAYHKATGLLYPDRDIDLDSDNTGAAGLWGDGRVIWVLDAQDKKSYAYSMSDGARIPDFDRPFGPDVETFGIWSSERHTWVTDGASDKLLAYKRTHSRDRVPQLDITLDGGNGSPRGIWSDGHTMYVLETDSNAVYTYEFPVGVSVSLSPAHIREDGGEQVVTVSAEYLGLWPPSSNVELITAFSHETTSEADIDLSGILLSAMTIPAGSWTGTKEFRLTPTNDEDYEEDETIQFSALGAVIPGVITGGTVKLTLVSDDAPGLPGLVVHPVPRDTSRLRVSWDEVEGAARYRVELESNGSFTPVTRANPLSTSETISGLSADTAYTIRVAAQGTEGDLFRSRVVGTTLDAMGAVSVHPVEGSRESLNVSWPAVKGAVAYRVDYRAGRNAFVEVDRDDDTSASETLQGLTAGTDYRVRVTARHVIDGTEQDGDRAAGSGTTVADLGAVTVAKVDNNTTDKLKLSWPASAGATGYRVEYQGEDDGSYTEFARDDDSLTTETITGLAAETAYSVRVTSLYTDGANEFDGDSAVGTGTTPPGPPPSLAAGHAPAIEISFITGNGVWFVWNNATVNGAAATHYTIEWSKKQAGPYEALDNPRPPQ